MPIIAIILQTFFSILLQVACYVYDTESKQKEKKWGGKKKEASRRRIRCFHPLINGFLKQSTSEEPADQ